MFIPIWLIVLASILAALFVAWSILAADGRNPLPFPDRGSHIFGATSPEAKDALVALLATYAVRERFQMDSSGIERSTLWDGTIINVSPQDVVDKLEGRLPALDWSATTQKKTQTAQQSFLELEGSKR
jgi:hypothetical protein